ncbi:hypothetical protein NO932_06395 [Pelagibacterium sp. 26DY04]|uniref:hypothetical protein n=1 Tax=Pelagibacterium sp. 26DY04 TaxID=2967130 RepID=UPI002814BED6|nr:hypothetical protein [Pelagibacterium sp. 26DY04]WMT88234.1 hypothetical protein NO932_06395 [Pelagibacterium sp. 26DY04]
MTDEEFKGAAEATAHDHLRSMLSLMARGARINLSGIPGDPTFLSSNISGETAQELAALISVQFGRGYMAALDDVESDAKAALPSGVRETDDLADKLCQAITHSGALMYQEEIVAVQDVIRKTLSAIEPTQAQGECETCGGTGNEGVNSICRDCDDPAQAPQGVSLDGPELWEILFGALQGDVPEALTDDKLSEIAEAINSAFLAPSPSHAETVAPYSAALRMIRDAVGELFGPVSDLESEEAVLLRGPEPHHEAEAIIAGMQRVAKRMDEVIDALKPSAETKAAYTGEFSFPLEYVDDDGNSATTRVQVPWTTIKEIMAAIRARAALHPEREG